MHHRIVRTALMRTTASAWAIMTLAVTFGVAMSGPTALRGQDSLR